MMLDFCNFATSPDPIAGLFLWTGIPLARVSGVSRCGFFYCHTKIDAPIGTVTNAWMLGVHEFDLFGRYATLILDRFLFNAATEISTFDQKRNLKRLPNDAGHIAFYIQSAQLIPESYIIRWSSR